MTDANASLTLHRKTDVDRISRIVQAILGQRMFVCADIGLVVRSPPSSDKHQVGRGGPRKGAAARIAKALGLKYIEFETWDVRTERDVHAAVNAARATGDFRLRAYVAPPTQATLYAWDPVPFSEGREGPEEETADIVVRAVHDGTSSIVRLSGSVPPTTRNIVQAILSTG